MKCSFCNKNIFKNEIIIFSFSQKKNIKYLQCSYCHSLHQYPIPDKKIIENYYETYFETKKKLNPGYLEKTNLSLLFSERDKTFNDLGFKKDWLINSTSVELGCANGQFLQYLKKNNATEIIGIDISKNLLESINIKGIKIILGDLSKIKLKSIDNLFLFNVLEHIPDIKLLMEQINLSLKNNGKILLEVPLTGFISSIFKKKWRFLMPDEHLHIPSKKGLKILLKKYGFKIIGSVRFGSGFTTGMIPNYLKNIFDKTAKKLHFGDRGAFLVVYNNT
jgi:SAM-dependent methyltransferase